MRLLIDTNVAIHLRDGDRSVIERLADLAGIPALSIISRVELEGGPAARPQFATTMRERNEGLFRRCTVIPFGDAEADAYSRILSTVAFSRAKVLDRMIAATAMVHDLTLVTMNGSDFRDVPDLRLEVWPAAQ